jgi:hypothetical protein
VCVFVSSVSSEENLDVDFWYKGVW